MATIDDDLEDDRPGIYRAFSDAVQIVLHFFSGRRRESDLQYHLERLFSHENVQLLVVSLDIIHSADANILKTSNVSFWRALRFICQSDSFASFNVLLNFGYS